VAAGAAPGLHVGCNREGAKPIDRRKNPAVRAFSDLEPGTAVFATAIGTCGLAWNRRGIDRVVLPGEDDRSAAALLARELPERRAWRRPPPPGAAVVRRLRTHLSGRPDDLRDVPIDLSDRSDFARAVSGALREVAPGETITYGALADRAGRPRAARAVGRVMAANPMPLIVPCHRCLPGGGSAAGRTGGSRGVGGFSSEGGPALKARLLFDEGVVLVPEHAAGLAHLRRHDPVLRPIIGRVGPYLPGLLPSEPPYELLVRSIIHQQLSVKAGRTIAGRVGALTPGPRFPAPDQLPGLADATLRGAGLSRQKIRYLRDLAARVADGRLQLQRLGRLADEAVTAQLTAVLGLGRWSAQMFLIFHLGRLDVLALDDIGLRNAVRHAYALPAAPDAAALAARAEAWRPYRSMASFYLWRWLDRGGV
jgi:DNA-3-methyladenine glycosylase II